MIATAEIPCPENQITELFTSHGDVIQSFVHSRCLNTSLSEDVTSEVFVAATRHLAKEPQKEISVGWLVTVAKRRLADHWRTEDRRKRLGQTLESQAYVHNQWLRRSEPLVETGPDELLEALPTRQGKALSLRYVNGLSVAEVADTLGLTYQGAESLLARGRRSLATSLKAA